MLIWLGERDWEEGIPGASVELASMYLYWLVCSSGASRPDNADPCSPVSLRMSFS